MKIIVTMLLVMFSLVRAYAAWAPIYSVEVMPHPASISDKISFDVSGEIGSSLWYVDSTQLNIAPGSISLDLYFKESGIGAPTITPWSHSENIGFLGIGSYDLTVRTYQNAQFADSMQTGFSVVPEPSSVGLCVVGGLIVFSRKRRFERCRERGAVWQMSSFNGKC